MPRVEVAIELQTITCYLGTCGITFAVPTLWHAAKVSDHTDFVCPNGHYQHFLAKTKEEQLREELQKARNALDYQRKRGDRLEDDKQHLKRQVSAQRGQVTKLKRKAAAGECAFCHQQFPDVASHVESEHPTEKAAAESETDE